MPSVAADRSIEEIVLCSLTGELLYEWQSKAVDRRIQLLDLIYNISASFGKAPPLTRGERVEIESGEARIILLLQPDRKVFVKSVPKK